MKEKVQIKIINEETQVTPQVETSTNSVENKKAIEIAGNLSYDYIKNLINKGELKYNKEESTATCKVYDLIY